MSRPYEIVVREKCRLFKKPPLDKNPTHIEKFKVLEIYGYIAVAVALYANFTKIHNNVGKLTLSKLK
jgi:hypothetical protein